VIKSELLAKSTMGWWKYYPISHNAPMMMIMWCHHVISWDRQVTWCQSSIISPDPCWGSLNVVPPWAFI